MLNQQEMMADLLVQSISERRANSFYRSCEFTPCPLTSCSHTLWDLQGRGVGLSHTLALVRKPLWVSSVPQ